LKLRAFISKQRLQLVIGLFIGLFVLTQTTTTYTEVQSNNFEAEEQSDSGEETAQLNISEAVPSSGSQINVDFQSFLLGEVSFGEETKEKRSPLKVLSQSCQKALKVLFRRIISPNAP